MKSYVIIGASNRGLYGYAKPMVDGFAHCAQIVGVFDPNSLRAEALKAEAGIACEAYTDFDRMLSEQKPDRAIITTPDNVHHEYIVKCLDAGVDVIAEKPLTTDAEKCLAILDAEKKNQRYITVTFNCRYIPYTSAIKQAILSGAVGDILSADMEWMLDTSHGADYFRRWHRKKENSGGLQITKSTHHFDLVNWWIDQFPVEVMAIGDRKFYGPTRAETGERCRDCKHNKTCEFYFDVVSIDWMKTLYVDCEKGDGYIRDMCPFSDECDIEDTLNMVVRYSGGTLFSYSLTAHSPYEGWRLSINGTKGRLEASDYHSGPMANEPANYFTIYDRKGHKIEHTIPKEQGMHGGGDNRLHRMLFEGGISDPLRQQAGSINGVASVLIGAAANVSIAEGRNIKVSSLLPIDEYVR